MQQRNDKERANEKVPHDIKNVEYDPRSVNDPLLEQLEKSKDMNPLEQNDTLEKLKKHYGSDE